jgi:hypothetical protein
MESVKDKELKHGQTAVVMWESLEMDSMKDKELEHGQTAPFSKAGGRMASS